MDKVQALEELRDKAWRMCRHDWGRRHCPPTATAPASAQEFSCWPFKPNPPAGCRGGLCAAAAVTLCALFCAGSASADPKGLWLAQDGAHVKVGPCGGALCATIATPRSAVDPETGRPWTDKNNPDPGQRGRPLVGGPVLYGLVAGWSGEMVRAIVQHRQRQQLCRTSPRAWPRHDPRRRLRDRHLRRPEHDPD